MFSITVATFIREVVAAALLLLTGDIIIRSLGIFITDLIVIRSRWISRYFMGFVFLVLVVLNWNRGRCCRIDAAANNAV